MVDLLGDQPKGIQGKKPVEGRFKEMILVEGGLALEFGSRGVALP